MFISQILNSTLDVENQDVKNLKSNLSIYDKLIDFDLLGSEIQIFNNLKENSNFSKRIINKTKSFCEHLCDFFLEHKILIILPNISKLFRIYLTLPISSSSAERSFSALKRIKTWLRNTMNEERLSYLAIITSQIDNNLVVKIFSEAKDRRLKFN